MVRMEVGRRTRGRNDQRTVSSRTTVMLLMNPKVMAIAMHAQKLPHKGIKVCCPCQPMAKGTEGGKNTSRGPACPPKQANFWWMLLKGVELSHRFQFVTPAVRSRTNLVLGRLEQTGLTVMLMLTAVGTGVQERPELREREITNWAESSISSKTHPAAKVISDYCRTCCFEHEGDWLVVVDLF